MDSASHKPTEIEDKDKEATQIITSQLSLLITSLTEENFNNTEKKINFLLDKSSTTAYIKYWKKLIIICSREIKPGKTANFDSNFAQKLLLSLFKSLSYKAPEVIDLLNQHIFQNTTFFDSIGITAKKLIEFFKIDDDKQTFFALFPSLAIDYFHSKKAIKMNNSKYFDTTVLQGQPNELKTNLLQIFQSLEGEGLNDMTALLLSEILSPGSQKLQPDAISSWFTPLNIVAATEVGHQVSQCLDKIPKESIDWNRIFNLMSTKYFLTTPVKPSLASLSSLLACLKYGPLLDQFFNCDWNISLKLELAYYLHKWSTGDGCFDILAVNDMKKVTDLVANSKGSLLYLMSIATLDLELFLLRDELVNHQMLPYYQECFFEDFNYVPEYLAFALLKNIKHFILLTESGNVIDEILVTLLVQVYEKSPIVLGILMRQLPDNDRIIEAGRIILNKEETTVVDFIKVLAEEDKLTYFIEKISFTESIKILPCAIKMGWSHLESFLNTNLTIETAYVVLDCLENQTRISDINLSFNASNIFDLQSLHFLVSSLMKVPLKQQDRTRFESIQFSLIITFPRLINFGFGHDEAILKNGQLAPIPSDIEKEMQNYLQKMYSGELAIKDIIDILRNFRDSDAGRDQDLFASMTHAVIAESSFFRDYPLDALATTSVLFGSMILFQLLRGFVLDVAFRIIYQFAKEGPESKMFKFAIQAIYAFKIRLSDYPSYSKDLLENVPGLQSQPQVYQSVLEASLKGREQNKSSAPDGSRGSVELISLKYFVVEEPRSTVPQENPPKEITEKVLFVVNNITMDNFDNKITDLKSVLNPNLFAWFSKYLVNQRAKTEPNYHKLYSRILTSIDSDLLHDYMIAETNTQLFHLLSLRDIHSIDKNHLKNLSLWLGNITLALDRPIKHRNIAFRELLLDAYNSKRLDIVVPFVAKVLLGAAESKIFRPPNPWTIGITKVLLEFNNKANWKLSLTFEVEVLLKMLGLQMSEITPSSFLEANDTADQLSGALGNMTIEQEHAEQQRQIILMQQYQQQILLFQQRQQRVVSNGAVFPTDQGPITVETSIPSDNPFSNLLGSTIFVTHPDLKRVFQMAIAKSVREILLPAVEKSSSIAVVTTTKIVLKDFATEVDEMKLKTAAVTMVRHLAQSLARATSVELLRDGIRSTTQSLAPNIMGMPTSPIEELEAAINDNLGLAVAIIEKASMDKATQDIAEQLIQPIAIRRYHKERRNEQPFITQNTNPYSLTLPEPLGLKSSGITPQQYRLYENSGKFALNVDNMPNTSILGQQQATNPQIVAQQQRSQQPPMSQTNRIPIPISQNQIPVQTPQNITIQNELEQNHRVLVHLMDSLVVQIKENADRRSLADLGTQNPIKGIIFQILTFIARSSQKDQLALKVSQAVVNSLFATSESSLCREVLSLLLEKLCSLSMVARKDVVWWLVYALDSRKFNVSVIRSLLDVNLIEASELDNVLVTAMKNEMENSIEFSIDIIKNTVMSDSPILMRMDFVRTLEYLGSLDNKKVESFLNEYESKEILPVKNGVKVTKKERYFLVFTEWVKLLQRVESDDISTLVFIRQMMEKNVLSNSDDLIEFIKAALELSISSFRESDPTGEVFTSIDAIGKLITKLLVLQDFSDITRSEYLHSVLSIVSIVFAKDHGQKDTVFNERPHFRLLSNLLYEWEVLRGHNYVKITDSQTRKELIEFNPEFYNIFSTYLHSLQPIAFPGFSFAWVTLVSHRMFLPTMLRLPNKAGWKNLMLLLIDLLNFLDTYTNKSDVSNAVSVVYKGALRVFLGISNDNPEFLIENHLEFMNNLPPTYFQLKNVILSAIPKKMMVPNPYDPNLSLEKLPACQQLPEVFYDPITESSTLKKPVDNYLRIPSNSLLKTILNAIHRTEFDFRNGVGYDYLSVDANLVRAVVLHVGVQVGLENQKVPYTAVFNTKSAYYTLLFNLIHEGNVELKYQVIQAMVDQLRYPNIHTYWFCYVLKNMLTSEEWGKQRADVQELILRNLLERIIVNKPHAWGVSVLFSQIIKQKEIDLLKLNFVKSLPDIQSILTPLYKHSLSTESAGETEDSSNIVIESTAVNSLDAKV